MALLQWVLHPIALTLLALVLEAMVQPPLNPTQAEMRALAHLQALAKALQRSLALQGSLVL